VLRYFLAIPLPDHAKDQILAVRPPATHGLRPVGRQELHLTVHFLGPMSLQSVEAARNALKPTVLNGFTIAVAGVGVFPAERRPRVLWAGVDLTPNLLALHRSVGVVLTAAIGYQPELRPYAPHVTLARVNSPVPPRVIEEFLAAGKSLDVPDVPVSQLVLYSSQMRNNSPHYHEEGIFELV
jgi:RNA 2',3'-cyclic 3'-phosphodiesterase